MQCRFNRFTYYSIHFNYASRIYFQDVTDKVVLITGGGGGVGAHLAKNFAQLNAKVIIWDINRDGKYKNRITKKYTKFNLKIATEPMR